MNLQNKSLIQYFFQLKFEPSQRKMCGDLIHDTNLNLKVYECVCSFNELIQKNWFIHVSFNKFVSNACVLVDIWMTTPKNSLTNREGRDQTNLQRYSELLVHIHAHDDEYTNHFVLQLPLLSCKLKGSAPNFTPNKFNDKKWPVGANKFV